MKNIVGSVLVLGFLLSVMFFPVATKQIFESIRNISASSEYEMRRIKVDSIVVNNATFGNGTETSTYYSVYSSTLDRMLIFTDHDKSVLLSKDGDDSNVKHINEYMLAHHDSIWVWYHPEAELKYARKDITFVSNREEWLYLCVSIATFIVATGGTVIAIRYFIKHKQKKKKSSRFVQKF